MIGLSIFLARGQKTEKDYYLGGNKTGAFPIAISTMATQCSTNSILGAPAFVAFTAGGGLLWLQYELALPLAMIAIMLLLIPFFRKLKLISVYAYLEERFGVTTRITMSVIFQVLRAFSTGVIVYGISLVISYCLGVSFTFAVIMLGVITIIYDSIGGMKAVIYSDVIQMVILYGCILMVLFYGLSFIGGFENLFEYFPKERAKAIDLHHTGFGDGKDFAFWPMLIGGFFLYVSYYGCDQTQVQRELSTRSIDDTNMSLFLNGILRFPLVLTYCIMGVVIGAYAVKSGNFISELPLSPQTGEPDYNMAVPVFVVRHFPTGMIGLFMVGLFAAAMSSLDSSINSISATSMEDVIKKFKKISPKQELLYSKLMTVFWGSVCVIFSFFVGDISSSIIVTINKIGSLINGPILGVFILGTLFKMANEKGALGGFIISFLSNIYLWIYQPDISWLWWNAIGFFVCVVAGLLISLLLPEQKDIAHLVYSRKTTQGFHYRKNWPLHYFILVVYFCILLFITASF